VEDNEKEGQSAFEIGGEIVREEESYGQLNFEVEAITGCVYSF
jgi:hypothetical protein